MQLNEERVKLFATILRLMTNPEIIKQLDTDEAFDYEALVRAIAEMVPYPQMLPIDKAAPVIYPMPTTAPFPTVPFPTVPNWNTPVPGELPGWTPIRPLIGDPPSWPNFPTVICSGGTSERTVVPVRDGTFSAMTQADGQGDDSGTRGD